MAFDFLVQVRNTKTAARTGVIHTPHGDIHTPAFVPVGTQATIKSLTPEELESLGVELFFVNTYHAYLRPGIEVIRKFDGLHQFMNWNRPLITDSGGFQVFSLGRSDLVKITEKGVRFRSHWDGSSHEFTPESSIERQHILGADIMIAFDECAPYPTTHEYANKAMERTHRWAERSRAANDKCQMINAKLKKPYQALYGVVQGSVYEDLRKESAKTIGGMDFDGIAIGGVAVGESKKEMKDVLDWVCPMLADDKPRHLLGVGEIDDIFELVAHGIDTFDCVQPTRLARMGHLLCRNKQINKCTNNQIRRFEIDITKREFFEDTHPLDEECTCYTCQHFSRAYIHHLFRVKELLAYRLATIHNLHFVLDLTRQIRESIINGSFLALRKKWLYD